jgi:Zn-dependent protease with chaperone function
VLWTGAGQAILHATVAALVVEALLRLWRVEDPGERLGLRWAALAAPVLLTPAYLVSAPWRGEPWFVERWSLFAGAHWDQVRLGGVGLASGAAVALAALGAALYLRDAIPWLADRLARTAPDAALPPDHPASARVRAAFAALPICCPGQLPAFTVIDLEAPVLLCTGIDRTAILVSTGTLDRLDHSALEAALAHELAHLATRDPLIGWWLMAVRTLQFFNPVVQIVARQAVQDLERRADVAVTALGRSRGLAEAVRRLSLASDVHSDLALPSAGVRPGDRVLASAHRRALDARCQLLIEGTVPLPALHRWWWIGLTGAALAPLLFLVV